ncbi:MAG: phosphatidylserine decarboxylase family protein [bacterium]
MTNTRRFIIAGEGVALTLVSLSLSLLFYAIGYYKVGFLFGLFTAFNLFFFRNPKRYAPAGNNVVAPADGEVILIKEVFEDRFLKKDATKISIFMSIFNVHVNRAPVSGEVVDVLHEEGRFFSANLDKATEDNEKNYVLIKSEAGFPVLVVQVAGLIARRIVCDVGKGDIVNKGEPYGLICYGSRLDIYLPKEIEVKIAVKDKTRAGETIIGEFKND